MQNLLGIIFDDFRVTVVLILLVIVLSVVFGVLSDITDRHIENEQANENIENLQTISINGFYLLIAVSGIATVLALLAWFSGFLGSILDLIRV